MSGGLQRHGIARCCLVNGPEGASCPCAALTLQASLLPRVGGGGECNLRPISHLHIPHISLYRQKELQSHLVWSLMGRRHNCKY